MASLLGPILAQAVTFGVGDRTEGRYIVNDDNYFEASTAAAARLRLGWERGELSLSYGPTVTVSPLEEEPREVALFHSASLSGTYRWRHTSLTLSQSVGYGELNLRAAALQGTGQTGPAAGPDVPGSDQPNTPEPVPPNPSTPNPSTPNPTTPGPNSPGPNNPNGLPTDRVRSVNAIVGYGTATTSLTLNHALSRNAALGADANYTVSGGTDDEAQQTYPLTHNWYGGMGVGFDRFRSRYTFGVRGGYFTMAAIPGAVGDNAEELRGWTAIVNAGHLYRLTARDDAESLLSYSYAYSSNENRVQVAQFTEAWRHEFDRQTSSRLSGGIAASRTSQGDGLVRWDVFPTAGANITHFAPLARGRFGVSADAIVSPRLDPLRARVDPGLVLASTVGWNRDRFSTAAAVSGSVSLTGDDDRGAFNSVNAGAGVAYLLGAGFVIDAGVRGAWEEFQGATIVPPSWAAFVGVTFGAEFVLRGEE